MNKKEKFIKSVIHIVTFDNRKYEQIEVLYNQLINSAVKECVKEADSVQNPYPKSVFPMDTDGYVKAIPDEHLRTAISRYCGRIFFDIAKKEIVKVIKDKE